MLSALENTEERKLRGLVGWKRVGYQAKKGDSRTGQGLA